MSEENLSDLLERAADRRNVGSPPLEQMLSNSRRARRRHSAVLALATAVAVGSVIAGGTLLANHDDGPGPNPADGSVLPSNYPTVVPAGDVATWALAPHQALNAATTSFTVLVTRLACSSGVTGKVLGPSVVLADDEIVVSFSAAPRVKAGGIYRCQGNNSVPVTVRLSQPLGSRALVDGQCSNTRAATTIFCRSSKGVRWSGRSSATSHGSLTEAEFAVALGVAKDEQAQIRGTFIGATATAHNDTFKKGDCASGRTLHIRLVWDKDAKFDHTGIGRPDGPRKALILFAGPKTGHVCRTESRYRDVGATPNETLLYGEWPDPKDS